MFLLVAWSRFCLTRDKWFQSQTRLTLPGGRHGSWRRRSTLSSRAQLLMWFWCVYKDPIFFLSYWQCQSQKSPRDRSRWLVGWSTWWQCLTYMCSTFFKTIQKDCLLMRGLYSTVRLCVVLIYHSANVAIWVTFARPRTQTLYSKRGSDLVFRHRVAGELRNFTQTCGDPGHAQCLPSHSLV